MPVKTEVPCKCDLASRQAKADSDAADKMRPLDKRLWHTPSCPIAQLVELRRCEKTLASVLEKEPLPTFEEYHEHEVAGLRFTIKRLSKKLEAYL